MEVSLQSEVRGGVSVDQQTGVIGGEMREEEAQDRNSAAARER